MFARSFWCKKVRFLAFASKSRFFGFFVVHSVGLDSKPRKVQFHGKILPGVLYLPRLRPVGAQKGFKCRSRSKTDILAGVAYIILNIKPTTKMATVSVKLNAVKIILMGAWTELKDVVLGFVFCLIGLLTAVIDLNLTITNLLQNYASLLFFLRYFKNPKINQSNQRY